jgi:surface antigen
MFRTAISRLALATLVVALALPIAAPAHAFDKEGMGTLLGAGLGGLLGNQFGGGSTKVITTSIGVFAGGLAGRSIGGSLDRADRAHYNRGSYGYTPQASRAYYQPNYVAQYAPPPQRVVYVREPEPIYVQDSYVGARSNHGDRYCREYSNSVRIGNQWRDSYGTACLQPDGSWEVVD